MSDPTSTPPAQQTQSQLRLWLSVCALLMAVATFLYQDAIFSGGERVVGADNTEVDAFLWGFHWIAQSVLENGELPYRSNLLNFPEGGVLWVKEQLFGLALLPVVTLLGIPTAYTLSQIFHSIIAALAFVWLCRLLGIRALPATLGALTYAFCPHQLGEAYNGNIDAMNIGWAPLWLAAMINALYQKTGKSVAFAAFCLCLLLLGNQYYALSMAMVSLPVIYCALRAKQIDLTKSLPNLAAVSASVFGGLLLFAPAGYRIYTSLREPDRLNDFMPAGPQLLPPALTDVNEILHPMLRLYEGGLPFQDLVYPGLLLVILACLAPFTTRIKGGWRVLWPLLALFFLSLSLGSALFYQGHLLHPEAPIYLPWHYLVIDNPLLNSMTLPQRMAVPAGLFFSLAASFGLDGLYKPLPKWAAHTITALLFAIALGEIVSYPPYAIPLATTPVKTATHAKLLKKIEQPGAVINVPPYLFSNRMRSYLWHQTQHGRPIADSLRIAHWPDVANEAPFFHHMLFNLTPEAPPIENPQFPGQEDPWGIEVLRQRGFAFVVFHVALASEQSDSPIDDWQRALTTALGPGLALSDNTVIFALDPTVAEALPKMAQGILGENDIVGTDVIWSQVLETTMPGPRNPVEQQNP